VLGGEPVVDGDDLGARPAGRPGRPGLRPGRRPRTYTPPWKYSTTWRGSTRSTVISATGTPPSAAAVTVTSPGSGCADVNSRSSRRCSLTSMSAGKADCRRIALRFSRCSVLTEDPPLAGLAWPGSAAGRTRPCQSAAEISCREAATTRLAARQVRRLHRITVIRATRAPQGRFPAAAVRMLVPARPGATPCAPSFKNGIDICGSRACWTAAERSPAQS
jgi:hypothetical protein